MPEENTRILIVIVIGIVMLLSFAVATVAFLWAFQRRRFAHVREKEGLKVEFEQELLRSSLEIQESTHTMIGRELHDNIGQILAVARLYVSSVGDELEGEGKEKSQKAEELIRNAMSGLRGISHRLNAEGIRAKGLPNSLRDLCTQVTQSGKIQCQLSEAGQSFALSPQHSVLLFRMCQELLNNAIRHSGSETIAIGLTWNPGNLEIKVQDLGAGFDPASIPGGHGLSNIQSRSKLLKAAFSIDSQPGEGTIATILYTPDHEA